MRELAPEGGADLGDRPRLSEPVEPRHQRILQAGRHRSSIRPVAFEYGFRQLFDEERHAVGACNDLIPDTGRQDLRAADMLYQCRDVELAQPCQGERSHMRVVYPGRRKFRARGDQEQYWQASDARGDQ